MLRSYFLSSFIEFHSAVSEEKSKVFQQIRGQCSHLVFPVSLKNTCVVEDVETFIPVKFCWIPFSSFRTEVENVSANQRPEWPSCFSDRPKIHKLGRCWDLASCQVSLNYVQWFQRTSWKCPGQSEAKAAILFSRSAKRERELRWCFLSSFVEFRSTVSEKLKMWKVVDGRTMDDGQCTKKALPV